MRFVSDERSGSFSRLPQFHLGGRLCLVDSIAIAMSAPEGLARPNVAPATLGADTPVPSGPLPAAWHAWAVGAPVALALIDDAGAFAWINAAFERLTGLAVAQAVNNAAEPLLAGAAAPGWLPAPGELARRHLQRHDGAPLHCDVQLDPLDAGLRVLTLLAREPESAASANKDDLQPLLATELARRLDEITSTSGIGVWRVLRDDSAAEWNAQMYALVGLDVERHGPGFAEWVDRFVHPDDRDRVRAVALRWRTQPDTTLEIAHRIVRTDGQLRHVVSRSRIQPEDSPYRATGVAIDVTERELALAALREATERSAMATRAAGIGIWEWDPEAGISRWNEEMFVLRGREPRPECPSFEEMTSWVHPDDRAYVADQIQSARVGDRLAYYEFRILRGDGQTRWIASRSMPVRDEHGRTRVRLGVNWDNTEAREAAAARHERELVLRESQAKSELLARMSHELRTPMNAVLGFTQLLLADEDSIPDAAKGGAAATSTRRARLEHIRSAGQHLLTLINDVLELSRIDGPARDLVLQPVRMGAVIAESLSLVEVLALQHGVTVAAPTSALHVRADATRLKQVLVNLLTNAIKYNRPGGNVHLEVLPDAGHVLIRVSDDGVGMTSAQQADAFEPFNRAGAERAGIEGTGIGLTIVKALVEGMGGRIAVHSAPGVGSVFEVRLDAAAEFGPLALPAQRLLYIEDNDVNVLIVKELVKRRPGIEFDSMPDGASGVARAAQTLPGLTLVDMHLPDFDGLEVLARLRANPLTAGLRVVALSANAIPADIQRALQAGFDDYWTKPLDFRVFNSALDQVFGHPPRPQDAVAPTTPAA